MPSGRLFGAVLTIIFVAVGSSFFWASSGAVVSVIFKLSGRLSGAVVKVKAIFGRHWELL